MSAGNCVWQNIPTKWSVIHFCWWLLPGKTITLARTLDIPRSVHNFRFFASSMLHHTAECTQMDHQGCIHYTVRDPVGIGGCCSGKLGWEDVPSALCRADLAKGRNRLLFCLKIHWLPKSISSLFLLSNSILILNESQKRMLLRLSTFQDYFAP